MRFKIKSLLCKSTEKHVLDIGNLRFETLEACISKSRKTHTFKLKDGSDSTRPLLKQKVKDYFDLSDEREALAWYIVQLIFSAYHRGKTEVEIEVDSKVDEDDVTEAVAIAMDSIADAACESDHAVDICLDD